MTTFSSLGVPADLASTLARLGISEPYPIQATTIEEALDGRDIFAQSPTGSGKTLAFAIPVVARVGKARQGRPKALVLAPTRELAAQIAAATRPLARTAGREVASFYGGTGFDKQLSALRRGVDIAVGCPGRLIDLVDRRALALGDVEIVVIDEADRMADMGFLPAVRRLLRDVPITRQTMLYSATLSSAVEQLVSDFQDAPRRHVLDAPADDMGSREHEVWRSARDERATLTAKIVASYRSSIVFCRTKHGVDRLARQLTKAGLVTVALHGNRTQSQRDRAISEFSQRRARVLVGTDVASRGLHVEGVDCVVHFDPPEDDDTYVHRSGRTGRAGASGVVVSIVTSEQEATARRMHKRLGIASRIVVGKVPEAVAAWPSESVATPTARPSATTADSSATARRASAGGRRRQRRYDKAGGGSGRAVRSGSGSGSGSAGRARREVGKRRQSA